MRNSIEYRGVGQSGYAAGRGEHDPALEREMHTRNATYPKKADDEERVHDELDVDDRFTGRGGEIPPDEPE